MKDSHGCKILSFGFQAHIIVKLLHVDGNTFGRTTLPEHVSEVQSVIIISLRSSVPVLVTVILNTASSHTQTV